jgi:TRAP transporter 4TM/12TM fusion protein
MIRSFNMIAVICAVLIPVLALLWASGAPLALGLRVWTEQLLIASVGLAMALSFLTKSVRREARQIDEAPTYDRMLATIALVYGLFLTLRFPYLTENLFYAPREALVVAAIGIVLLAETVRRAIGLPLLVILATICLYALFAEHLTGPLQSRSVGPARLATFAILDSASMTGAALTIGVVVVVPYIVLARLLLASGGSAFFSDLSISLLGGTRGGAGKIAVLGSAFFGSISGSAVSNVASTGAITIPLMIKAGYRARTAAAIEASASTGGQLVPPIMGASAFLLAENLQVAYAAVISAALIPAILYYVSLLAFADFEAARRNLKPVEGTRPRTANVMLRGWFVLTPFAILVFGLFTFNWRPEMAALVAVCTLFAVALFKTYDGPRITISCLWVTLIEAGRTSVDIILICAVASIVIGIFNLSGLSFGLTFFLVQVGQGSLILLLLLTAILCIILGMGLPTVGVYLLLAALAAPPLIELGISPMSAHLFVLYFGMLSMITPPVAIAAFVAANMANTPPMATAVEAVRVGWTAFIVPFLFVASPALLMIESSWGDIALSLLTAIVGILMVTGGVVGWLRVSLGPLLRVASVAAGIMLLITHTALDFGWAINGVGAVLSALIWVAAGRMVSTRALPS